MSIFRSTFKNHISKQLQVRQALMSQGSEGGARTENVQKYTTSKRAWSRMASFVNYEDKSRGYSGDALSRKYVLQAGTLFQDHNNDKNFDMRFGVGKKNGAYGSDLGGYSKGDKFYGDRQLGLRPMPGITSITIQSKTAYGSLRQATIKYKAWSKSQLEDLEILFMRMKYPVLLEWGWSMYMNTYTEGTKYTDKPDKGSLKTSDSELNRLAKSPIRPFTDSTIDPFDDKQSQDDIYEKIKVLQHRFSGNYDGMLGFVENFTWELAADGGFECTTVLISMGDVLASLKMNRPTPARIGLQSTDTGYKSNFTQILEDFVNNGPIQLQTLITDPGVDISQSKLNDTFTVGNTKNTAAKDSLYYIQLAYFIAILNEKNNLYDGKGEKLVNIELPTENKNNRGNGLCLASEDSVSIDPSICLIKNKKATFATGLPQGFDIASELNNSTSNFKSNYKEFDFSTSSGNNLGLISKDFLTEGEKPGRNFGIIGNIYVSIHCIRSLFEDMSSKKDVPFYDFIKELLNKMSYALGGINDFDLFVYDNKAVIIDKNYTERGKDATTDNKFKLNLFGNNSIVRNYKVMSKIFQSQASEVAIAASNRENLGSYNTSTQSALNKGLSNRLVTNLTQPESIGIKPNDAVEEYREKEKSARSLLDMQKYLQDFLTKKMFPTEAIPTANTLLKSILLTVNSDANYKSIIPISLEVTMDGVGGIDIGEIFTVEEGVLPKEYERKHLGFIVVKESHIITNDWTTTIEGKVVLLDQNDTTGYADTKKLKDSLINAAADAVHKDLINAQHQVLYYRQILALIKMYYEDYFEIAVHIKLADYERDPKHYFSKSELNTDVTVDYVAIVIRKDKNEVILKYEVNNTEYEIKASDALGSLTDNYATVAQMKKYESYARLDEKDRKKSPLMNYTTVGYREVEVLKGVVEKGKISTVAPLLGGGSYQGDPVIADISSGYINLLGPFKLNGAKEEIKQFLKSFITTTTHYKELPAGGKLKMDIDNKLNQIGAQLLYTNKFLNTTVDFLTGSTAQLAIDVLTPTKSGVDVVPLKAEQVGSSIDYVEDIKSKFTITYK